MPVKFKRFLDLPVALQQLKHENTESQINRTKINHNQLKQQEYQTAYDDTNKIRSNMRNCYEEHKY